MNEKNENGKKSFKIFKVMKPTSKSRFSHYLFNIIFGDVFWRSHFDIYIWVPDTTIEGMRNEPKNFYSAKLLLGVWPKIVWFSIPEHFLRTPDCVGSRTSGG